MLLLTFRSFSSWSLKKLVKGVVLLQPIRRGSLERSGFFFVFERIAVGLMGSCEHWPSVDELRSIGRAAWVVVQV